MEAVQDKTQEKTQQKALQKKEGDGDSGGISHAPPQFKVNAGVDSSLQRKTENGSHLSAKGAPQFQLKAEEEKEMVQKKEDGQAQFSAGNVQVHAPSSMPFFQPKLEIGKPNDKYEQEADKVAAEAIKTPDSALAVEAPQAKGGEQISKKPAFAPPTINKIAAKPQPTPFAPPSSKPQIQAKEEDLSGDMGPERISRNPDFSSGAEGGGDKPEDNNAPGVQMKADGSGDASGMESKLASTKGGGSPLDAQTKQFMEPRIGADFSDVRVHTGKEAAQMSKEVGAQAFTHGKDVYFNEGKYDPGSDAGKELLAHELTHTVQQGAAPAMQTKLQRKEESEEKIQRSEEAGTAAPQTAEAEGGGEAEAPSGPLPKPSTRYSITNGFKPRGNLVPYLASNPDEWMDVDVKMHSIGSGTIKAMQVGETEPGQEATYAIKSGEYLEISGLPFLAPLREKGITPIFALENVSDPKNLRALPGFKKGNATVSTDLLGLFKEIVKNKEALGLQGLDDFKFSDVVSAVQEGQVDMMVNNIQLTVANYLDARGSFGFQGGEMVFDVEANVDVKGLAQGSFTISKGEGGLQGEGDIGVELDNISGNVHASYNNGAISIQGTASYQSEKFTGNVNLLVTDKAAADQAMYSGLGIEQPGMENATQGEAPDASPVTLTKENAALVGWGDVEVAVTDWLTGTANVGVDSDGYVTVLGEIAVNDPVTLMEQKDEQKDLFNYDLKFGYGVPLVGQIFVFVGIGMYANYGFGPLSLRDVSISGQYSTRPDIPTNIKIGGALNINAFAALGLEARGGAGVTLLGHDIKAGIKVTGEAGIKAYAEARPELEYMEQPGPGGGMVGETWLRGHFEAAAQMFLKLGGAFFIELDSPWWSPAPDDEWEWPFGSVEYPIGTQEFGIGGDVDWKVGSNEWPELQMSPVEFDSEKFIADMTKKPKPNASGAGGKKDKEGKWEDKSQKGNMVDAQNAPANGTAGSGSGQQAGTTPSQAANDRANLERKQREADQSNVDGSGQGSAKGGKRNERRNQQTPGTDVNNQNGNQRNQQDGKDEDGHTPDKQAAIKKGLDMVDQLEKPYIEEDGEITRDNAAKVAKTVKAKNNVFKSFKVIDGQDTWDYEYTASPPKKVKGHKKSKPAKKATPKAVPKTTVKRGRKLKPITWINRYGNSTLKTAWATMRSRLDTKGLANPYFINLCAQYAIALNQGNNAKAGVLLPKVIAHLQKQNAFDSPTDGGHLWSGVKSEAQDFAEKKDTTATDGTVVNSNAGRSGPSGVVLETTGAGGLFDNIDFGKKSRGPSGPLWDQLSEVYAEGFSGEVHIHQYKGFRISSVFYTKEKAVLDADAVLGKVKPIYYLYANWGEKIGESYGNDVFEKRKLEKAHVSESVLETNKWDFRGPDPYPESAGGYWPGGRVLPAGSRRW